jgi:hypothetical protein
VYAKFIYGKLKEAPEFFTLFTIIVIVGIAIILIIKIFINILQE